MVLNMLSEVNENKDRQLNEIMKMSYERNEIINKKIEITLKIEILKLKNIIYELKQSLDWLHRRVEQVEERINELVDGSLEIIESEEQKGKRMGEKKSEESLKRHHQMDQYTHYGPGWRREKEGAKRLLVEVIAKNSSNLRKDMSYNAKVQQIPSGLHPKISTKVTL